jgi:hypothetical protein
VEETVVIELLKVFPLVLFIFTHPLEQISLKEYRAPESPILFFMDNHYVAPGDGFIKNSVENNGFFQVTLSLDSGYEIIYSGLIEIKKQTGDRIVFNEIIGKDTTISTETKFIMMFYEKTELFPQFENKNLTFLIKEGTKVNMIADGNIIAQYYDTYLGIVSKVKITNKSTYITYSHLKNVVTIPNIFLYQGDYIALSGNTGYSENPRLVLHIEDSNLGDNIRVVYFRR